ncbi:MAG: hypothetical protein ABL993_00965 [Vicinamibacterales bacterium]
MKFDLPEQFVDQVLAVLQEAPVPFKIVNPMLQEFLRQANDKKIQSLEYPTPTIDYTYKTFAEFMSVKDTPDVPDTESARVGWNAAMAVRSEPRLSGESNG